MTLWKTCWARADVVMLLLAAFYPLVPGLEDALINQLRISVGQQLSYIFIYAVLALGLNVVVGYTGLLHLGIAAFWGIGCYVTAILRVPGYPFQFGFLTAIVAATCASAGAGIVLGAPTLRLRGDYLAIVTLGFGEVVRFGIRNSDAITHGTQGLNPVPPPQLPSFVNRLLESIGWGTHWALEYRLSYYLMLAFLAAVVWLLHNLQRSRLGRAWMAIREDELAATCMGINAARVKLSAFAIGAGLAGLAGSLYATAIASAPGPDVFDFNHSIMVLCAVIIGGLGSLRGALLGTLLVFGFDSVLTPIVDSWVQRASGDLQQHAWMTFSGWRLMLFGAALIIVMRFRPEGLLPAFGVSEELHPTKPGSPTAGASPTNSAAGGGRA